MIRTIQHFLYQHFVFDFHAYFLLKVKYNCVICTKKNVNFFFLKCIKNYRRNSIEMVRMVTLLRNHKITQNICAFIHVAHACADVRYKLTLTLTQSMKIFAILELKYVINLCAHALRCKSQRMLYTK